MNFTELNNLVNKIIEDVYRLKAKYISESLEIIDYVGIAPKTKSQRTELIDFLKKYTNNHIVYSDDWGDVYRLPQAMPTIKNHIDMIKPCFADDNIDKKSYADFRISQEYYNQLNSKYSGQKGFINMSGDGWEIIGVQDEGSPVSLYIPNIPLSYDVSAK